MIGMFNNINVPDRTQGIKHTVEKRKKKNYFHIVCYA